jgi:hypothetical protein
MKKITSIIAVFMLAASVSFAQYYSTSYINEGKNPGGLNNDQEQPTAKGWKAIQGPASTPTWSAVTTLPFTFNFNGAAVTSFKASTSGIVTFTTGATAVPSSTSAALPSVSIPDNSICVWGLAGTGTNDSIRTKTFGTTPNRQFWIQYNSYSCSGSTGYTYWSIVLEETTNNIYVVDHYTYNAPLALSIGVQINSTTAISIAGSPTIGSQTGTSNLDTPLDNTYYQFTYGTQPANEMRLKSVAPAVGSQGVWGLVGSSKAITGTVTNLGSAAITSFTAKYNDGTTTTTNNFTGLNIAPGANYNFTCTPYNIPAANIYSIKAWVELTGDTNPTNDTLPGEVKGYSFLPNHKVVFEEGTGTWCGWCVRGAVYMDSIHNAYPNSTVTIAVHNADPMVNTAYDTGINPLISGYPTIVVNRIESSDPKNAFTQYTKHINDFGMGDLTLTPSFNSTTRIATVKIDAKMAATFANHNSKNDYRLALVFAEDDVKGTAASYAQHNYYSGGSSGAMSGAGHNFATEPGLIPAANMQYDFVARTIVGGFSGLSSSLPSSIVADSTYSYTYTYTVPNAYNVAKMNAHALLIDAKSSIVYNANSTSFAFAGINTIAENKQTFSLYPNPAENILNMDLELKSADKVVVSVINCLGQTVLVNDFGTVNSGKNTYSFDVSNLTSGAYFITVSTSEGIATSKFIK